MPANLFLTQLKFQRMKKISKAFLSTFLVFISCTAFAQFELEDHALNIGLGLGGTYASGYHNSSPGIVLSYEQGQWGNIGPGTISLGGFFSYKSYGYRYHDPYFDYSWHVSYTTLGVRGAYHYTGFSDKHWDPYGGLMLAFYFVGYRGDDFGSRSHSGLYPNLFLGGRYYFSDNWGVHLEVGFGAFVSAIGVTYKF